MTDQTLQVKSEKVKVKKGIPDGWKMTTLGEVVEIIDGDRGVNYPKNNELFMDGHCLFLNTKNIPNDSFSFEEKIFVDQEKDLKLRKGKLKRGDFVLTTRGTVGNFAFYSEKVPFDNIRINSGMVILRAREKFVNKSYLNFYLKSHFFKNQVLLLSSGTAQPQLPIRDLTVFQLYLPLLPEQRAIAAVLSSLDDKIELLREQNKTLEATAQAIFKEWFVNFNFPCELKVKSEKLKGKTVGYKDAGGKMIDSELGQIPEGWRVGKLGEVIELFDSKRVPLASDIRAKRKGQYPYYGATSIMDYIDDYLFDGTYLLLAEDGSVMDNNGRPMLQFVWGKFWVSNHAHVIQGKNGFSTEMLQVLLKNANVAGIVNGAVQLKINQANLLSFEILIPTKEIVRNFDSILQPIFQKIKNITSQIETLSQLRDTLLPKLMKGELRVKSEKLRVKN